MGYCCILNLAIDKVGLGYSTFPDVYVLSFGAQEARHVDTVVTWLKNLMKDTDIHVRVVSWIERYDRSCRPSHCVLCKWRT